MTAVSPLRALKRLTPRTVRRFRRDEDGATAVEFSLVAIPFFALMFAIFESALVFLSQQFLETAVGDTARLIRTGQVQQQSMAPDAFRSSICSKVQYLFDCSGGLQIDVRTYGTFASMDLTPPLDEDGNLLTDDFTFQVGDAEQIVVVRTFYEYPVYVTGFGYNPATLPNGKVLIAAAAAFRNEPFPW